MHREMRTLARPISLQRDNDIFGMLAFELGHAVVGVRVLVSGNAVATQARVGNLTSPVRIAGARGRRRAGGLLGWSSSSVCSGDERQNDARTDPRPHFHAPTDPKNGPESYGFGPPKANPKAPHDCPDPESDWRGSSH